MPIYEYQCGACGAAMERLQKVSDAALTDCPQCGKPELRKLVSAAGFRLKGGGWYETDFKSGQKKNLVEGAGKSTSTDSTGSSVSTTSSTAEAKPSSSSSSTAD